MNTNEQTGNDARKIYIRRTLTGAIYGFLMGTAFVIVSAFINIWLYPGLPMGVDWDQVLVRWFLIGLGLTLIGALTCLFAEKFHGLLAGSVTAGLLILTTALFLSSTGAGAKFVVLIFVLAPIAVMALPVVWLLRRLMERHALALQMNRSFLRIALLMLTAVSAGAFGGYFMKMSRSALISVQMVHENLQAAPQNRNDEVSQTAGLQEHAGMRYSLFQRASTTSTVGFDIRAEYEDGYKAQCVVVVYPGTPPYIRSCEAVE